MRPLTSSSNSETPSIRPALADAPGAARRIWLGWAAGSALSLLTRPAGAQGHVHAPGAQQLRRSHHHYTLPAVSVVRHDGSRLAVQQVVDDGRPVLLNFIYTTCTTICPVSSQVFLQVRELLGSQRDDANMVSFSIDPEQDTPRRLLAYARRFGSAGIWPHFTGQMEDCLAVQRAFNAWRGDKMNHTALTLMRARPGQPWLRLDGFAAPEQILAEYRHLLKA